MSASEQSKEPLLPRSGNYRALYTYQKAEAIYDITYYFCKNYLQRDDRTIDQMIQAAPVRQTEHRGRMRRFGHFKRNRN